MKLDASEVHLRHAFALHHCFPFSDWNMRSKMLMSKNWSRSLGFSKTSCQNQEPRFCGLTGGFQGPPMGRMQPSPGLRRTPSRIRRMCQSPVTSNTGLWLLDGITMFVDKSCWMHLIVSARGLYGFGGQEDPRPRGPCGGGYNKAGITLAWEPRSGGGVKVTCKHGDREPQSASMLRRHLHY